MGGSGRSISNQPTAFSAAAHKHHEDYNIHHEGLVCISQAHNVLPTLTSTCCCLLLILLQIGVAVAVVAELLTESSIFRHFSADTVSFLGSMFIGAVSLAAAAACASKRRMGVELLEAVVTSLTANQRSAASITGRQVDTAVDNILNKAFDLGTIYSILPEDEDLL